MTAIAIIREEAQAETQACYRAISRPGNTQATGKTAGEALDALTAQLNSEERGTIVIVQEMQPDNYFTAAQIRRLQELTRRAQSALDSLSPEEDAERFALIKAELLASAQRTAAFADALGR